MSKITLEFNIPEEQEEADITLAAQKMYSVIWDTLQEMRSQLEHHDNDEDWAEGVEWVKALILQKLEKEEITNLF